MEKNFFRNVDELPLVLTVDDIRRILGISRVRAYELCKTDEFPSIRVSKRRIVICKKAFFQWIEAQSYSKVICNHEKATNG